MNYSFHEISDTAIFGMGTTALLCILVPLILIFIWYRRTKTKVSSALSGAAAFMVFAIILEPLIHSLILNSAAGPVITENIFLYALYGGLAAGIFEEAGRFVFMKLFTVKTLSPESSIMFGIGHGGMEAFFIGGLNGLSNLTTAASLNMAGIDEVLATVSEELRPETYEQLSALWTTPAAIFFLGAYERMAAIPIHICCSYIVYRAIADKKPAYFFLAVAIHAFIDGVIVIVDSYAGPYIAELILTVMVAVLIVFTVKEYKRAKSSSISNRPIIP